MEPRCQVTPANHRSHGGSGPCVFNGTRPNKVQNTWVIVDMAIAMGWWPNSSLKSSMPFKCDLALQNTPLSKQPFKTQPKFENDGIT